MAAFYFDQNVSYEIVTLLRASGHQVTTAYEIGLDRAEDDKHFLVAARRGWILVTTNAMDYRLLHDAWRRWFAAHRVAAQHHGIMIIPQREPARRIVQAILDLLTTDPTLTNELHEWRLRDGWSQRPLR